MIRISKLKKSKIAMGLYFENFTLDFLHFNILLLFNYDSQVIKEVLKNPEDKTQLSLIFANETIDDILLKSTLDALEKEHSNFKVTYVISKPPARYSTVQYNTVHIV